MFKIVGQLKRESAEDEQEFMVADKQNGITIQTLSTMRQILSKLPDDAMVEVGSLYNFYVDKVLARSCITKSGRLSYRGAGAIEIIDRDCSSRYVSKNPVVINGVNLGNAIYGCLRGSLVKDIQNHFQYNDGEIYRLEDFRFCEDVKTYLLGFIYFPKVDFFHFLPYFGWDEIDEHRARKEPAEVWDVVRFMEEEWLYDLFHNFNRLFFKMSGAFREEFAALRDSKVKSKDKLFVYGVILKYTRYALKIPDFNFSGFPISRMLTTLEKEHIIDTIPCLLGHSTGRLSQNGEHVRYKDMFGPSIIESFRKDSSARESFDKWFDMGVLEGVDDTNSYWYDLDHDIEERGNITGEYWEFTNPGYHGILRINQKTGKPVVKIIKNKR